MVWKAKFFGNKRPGLRKYKKIVFELIEDKRFDFADIALNEAKIAYNDFKSDYFKFIKGSEKRINDGRNITK